MVSQPRVKPFHRPCGYIKAHVARQGGEALLQASRDLESKRVNVSPLPPGLNMVLPCRSLDPLTAELPLKTCLQKTSISIRSLKMGGVLSFLLKSAEVTRLVPPPTACLSVVFCVGWFERNTKGRYTMWLVPHCLWRMLLGC